MVDYNLKSVQFRMAALSAAMEQLTEALQDTGYDCSQGYPFAHSLDEVAFEVGGWAYTHQRLIDQRYLNEGENADE
jgi:hypothetical protein|tara:strand:+ start:424 stop:651 length:228 start_codon:yes stop_codon:yes gene_type:complete